MYRLEGERLRLHRAGGVINIHTNDRTLAVDIDQAKQIMLGIIAILLDGHELAATPDTIEPPRSGRPLAPTPEDL